MVKKPKERPTFIEEARRKQIIASAIKTIAQRGMKNTSLEDIAQQIDVSKGVISYHFSNKAELIDAVIDYLLSEQRENRNHRMNAQMSPLDKLREYIRADMDYYQQHRENLVCWWELWSFYKLPQDKKVVQNKIYGPPRETLVKIIEEGQSSGEFKPSMDPFISAIAIEGSIEGVMLQWVFDETQVDLQRCGEELIFLFENRLVVG